MNLKLNLKEPFTLTLTQFSSADSISTHSRHLTSNINTFQAESNNKYSFTIKKLFYSGNRKSSKTTVILVWYETTNLFRANVDPS